jgi:hypothetical protein
VQYAAGDPSHQQSQLYIWEQMCTNCNMMMDRQHDESHQNCHDSVPFKFKCAGSDNAVQAPDVSRCS